MLDMDGTATSIVIITFAICLTILIAMVLVVQSDERSRRAEANTRESEAMYGAEAERYKADRVKAEAWVKYHPEEVAHDNGL